MNEVVYAIWDFACGYYCRCVDAYSWETMALGLGDSPTEALARAFGELLAHAVRESPGDR